MSQLVPERRYQETWTAAQKHGRGEGFPSRPIRPCRVSDPHELPFCSFCSISRPQPACSRDRPAQHTGQGTGWSPRAHSELPSGAAQMGVLGEAGAAARGGALWGPPAWPGASIRSTSCSLTSPSGMRLGSVSVRLCALASPQGFRGLLHRFPQASDRGGERPRRGHLRHHAGAVRRRVRVRQGESAPGNLPVTHAKASEFSLLWPAVTR